MKIIQLSPYFYPHLGGVESHVFELSKHLIERGHEVKVITSRLEGTKKKEVVDGVPVERVKPLFIALRTPILFGIRDALMKQDCDIVHGHSPPPLTCFWGVRTTQKMGVPFVLTYHCDLELSFPFGPFMVQTYQNTIGAYTVSKSDKIITTTDTYGATSRTVWQEDSRVIPNAVDADTFNPENDGSRIRKKHGIKEDENMVLYVGRVVPHKGIQYLIRSATYMDDNVKYVIVGTGEYKEYLMQLVRSNDLEDRVIFAGRVPMKELPEYYAATDVFVLPSISRLEAFGIVALEALASGVPVVVSDIPGVRDVIVEGRHGLLAEPMKPIDIAGKIRTILENPDMAKKMGELGRKVVEEKYTWDKVAEQIEGVYEDIIG